jgi:hypothetical protein
MKGLPGDSPYFSHIRLHMLASFLLPPLESLLSINLAFC